MNIESYDMGKIDIAWCPGCGNFGILNILKKALSELDIPPERLVIASGIGQAAKLPHYMKTNFFNGLHGRALPPATAIKVSNPELIVIIDSGACRGIAYALITYVEALLAYKIKNKNRLLLSRWIWRLISRPLFWIREEANEEYQAMSQTIYVLGKKL